MFVMFLLLLINSVSNRPQNIVEEVQAESSVTEVVGVPLTSSPGPSRPLDVKLVDAGEGCSYSESAIYDMI